MLSFIFYEFQLKNLHFFFNFINFELIKTLNIDNKKVHFKRKLQKISFVTLNCNNTFNGNFDSFPLKSIL